MTRDGVAAVAVRTSVAAAGLRDRSSDADSRELDTSTGEHAALVSSARWVPREKMFRTVGKTSSCDATDGSRRRDGSEVERRAHE